ncbi:phosphatase PAP2 family protein [Maribacter cobaltidurans]|uniref:Phosphatase PAP2 family protein n=1 Tax=Maribacter cobaltidurans TaxID=1178778 RepID=A0A223V0Q9_9FLAO|nr:phosphatase PAP2 family protein [Maribacter cobaltidurans]ASV29063.1 phosphatase PAP2 family protein [Maribacter cobaltidurans]GGD72202.1 phosphatase PAP2 family protein [Maribacter cobaltidurans]
MLDQLLQFDKDVFIYLNGLGSPTWDTFWQFISNKFSAIPLYLFLLILSFRKFGFKGTLVLVISVGLLITVSDQLSNFFKYGVARLRPCHDLEVSSIMRLVKSYCGGKYGYYSAHASNSFALAIFFGFMLRSQIRYIGLALVFWALLVAYSRIYIGVHFPLDVMTGALIGSFLGWLFAKLFIFAHRKFSL